jgi:hypothetical protein
MLNVKLPKQPCGRRESISNRIENRAPSSVDFDGIPSTWKHRVFQAVLLAFVFFVTISGVKGGGLGRTRFSWDAVADPAVSGYKVHWGTQSGVYNYSLDAGNVTEVIISEFSEGVEYFSAVTAHSDTGEESDYSTEVSFTVLPMGGTATPVITVAPTATAIIYGQTLASSTLSGGAATVPGSFAFTTPATVPAAGTASQSVTFTPSDTLNYQATTTSVSVMVTKAAATVMLGNLAAIYDGTPKSASATTDPAGITVNLTYDGVATVPTNAGSHAVVATIVDANHSGSASGTLVIAQAMPLITTQPTATDIIYGQTLASSTLSGGAASVPGSFGFATTGTASGGTLGGARFSWEAVADPVVSGYKVHWGTQSGVYDHSFDAGNVTEVIISGFSEGVEYFSAVTAYSNIGEESDYSEEVSFTVLPAGGTTNPVVGTFSQSVTFTPADTSNYQIVTTSVNVTVLKATPVITVAPTATAIIYGQTLASSTLSGGAASVPGSFAFTTPATVPVVGTAAQSVTFTPTDTLNYMTASTNVNVTVKSSTTQAIALELLEDWRVRCFSPEQTAAGQAAEDADPDRDGLVNLAEYALGTSPLEFTPPLTAAKNSNGLVLTFERPSGLPDVLYAAESSDDLIHWNSCLVEMVVDGPVQTMRAIDPLTSGNPARRFISLRFTQP